MASVDGFRSLQCASDESILKLCDACNYEGTEAESSHFCDNCKEFFVERAQPHIKSLRTPETIQLCP